MIKLIPYSKQCIDNQDINAVLEVLRSDWLTQGPKVREFEQALCRYTGAKYAVVVSSGTAALHIACIAAGVKSGDEVITSPITFLASANCALYSGAKPVFIDIRPKTGLIDIDKIRKYFSRSRKVKAVIPVHFAGCPCNVEQIYQIVRNRKIIIIEDAAHALGAKYKVNNSWAKVGSCRHSDMSVFSFHPVKHISTGEGGAITTNNKKFYESLLSLRSHGVVKTHNAFKYKSMAFTGKNNNLWYYEMQALGFNYRLTDLQCALGISQLKKLNHFVSCRRKIVSLYNQAFKDIDGLNIPIEAQGVRSSYHLYVLRIDFPKLGKTKNEVMLRLRQEGIGTQVHYIPVYLQPFYRRTFHYKKGDYPRAEDFYEKALSIPCYPAMTEKQVKFVITKIKQCLKV